MKTIVITGCAGLIGSHLSRYLLEHDYYVIGIDDLSGGYREYLPTHDNFTFYELDISNKVSANIINTIFTESKPTTCFHLAAYAAECLSPFIRHYNYTNNVLSSMNIINACITHGIKLIFTSSMAVYGHQEAPFTESMTPKPSDPYGVAKYAVELDLEIANKQHGLRYTIVRPHNVIGIYQNIWDRYRNVVGIFIRQALNNDNITIYGDGLQTRAFSDISYFLRPFELLIDGFDQEVFNIGADKTFNILDLAHTVKNIANQYNYHPEVIHMPPRFEVKHAFCDHSKAKKELSFTDNTILEDMVSKMFIWASNQTAKNAKIMSYEIKKDLYDYWK